MPCQIGIVMSPETWPSRPDASPASPDLAGGLDASSYLAPALVDHSASVVHFVAAAHLGLARFCAHLARSAEPEALVPAALVLLPVTEVPSSGQPSLLSHEEEARFLTLLPYSQNLQSLRTRPLEDLGLASMLSALSQRSDCRYLVLALRPEPSVPRHHRVLIVGNLCSRYRGRVCAGRDRIRIDCCDPAILSLLT